MKKIKLLTLLASILLTGTLPAQTETWNIVDKNMGQWNDTYTEVNASNSYAWGHVPVGGPPSGDAAEDAFSKFITQFPGFVRLQKPKFSSGASGTFLLNANVGNITSGDFHNAIQTNTSYTIEVKIQVYAKFGGDADANEVRMRLAGCLFDFFISYGDGTTGYVRKKTANDYEIDPTVPHVYRIEYTSGTKFDLYVDDVFAFSEAKESKSGANILVIGAALGSTCNMDLYYVKMKTAGSATWDILNKYMDQWNGDNGGWNATSVADWEIRQDASITAGASVTKASEAGIDYVNIAKNVTTGDFYLSTPETSTTQIGAETIEPTDAYTVEVKARIPAGDANDGNIIKVRLFDKIMGIVLLDGKIANAAKHPTNAGLIAGTEEKPLTTSNWNTYRLIMSADQTTASVYVNGEAAFTDLPTLDYESGNSVIRLGAESFSCCDMDVAYVKMGSGAFLPGTQTYLSPLPESKIALSPSVVSRGGNLTIHAATAGDLSVEIMDVSGKIISVAKIAASSGDVRAPETAGVYFVRVNRTGTAKIIVR